MQLAEAASRAAVLQLTAAIQAARLLKLKMREATLQQAEAVSLAAVLQPMAAMLAARLLQMKTKEGVRLPLLVLVQAPATSRGGSRC